MQQEIEESLSALRNVSDKAYRNALHSLGDLVFKGVMRGPELRLRLVHKNGVLKPRAEATYKGRAVEESDRSKLVFRKRQEQTPEETFRRELQRFEKRYESHAPSLYDCLAEITQHVVEARDGKVVLRFDAADGFQIVASEEL
jgi:hypothetical protein